MKAIAILLALTAVTATAQTIRIADNNANRPTGSNIFSTVQAAVNAAVPGDIVYVQPSDTKYNETVTISKRITLMGAGFAAELGTRNSWISSINLITSTDGINTIGNTRFSGLVLDYVNFTTGSDVGSFPFADLVFENCSFYRMISSGNHRALNNLVIRNCNFAELSLTSSNGNTNTSIYRNYISPDQFLYGMFRIDNASNLLVSNNLFYPNPSTAYSTVGIVNSSNVRIEHNVFSRSGSPIPTFEFLRNVQVVNNIFYGVLPTCINTSNVFRDNVFSNNLVLTTGVTMPPDSNPVGSSFHSGINNLVGVSPQFTNAPNTSYSFSHNYTLLPGSPCIAAATTGENIGPSGGLYPWTGNLTLRPSGIPLITQFGNSGVVPQNQPLKSNIKAKSN